MFFPIQDTANDIAGKSPLHQKTDLFCLFRSVSRLAAKLFSPDT